MNFTKTLLVASIAMAACAANAATYSTPGSAQTAIPGSFSWQVNAGMADPMASLSFVLQGYKSVDGLNAYSDLFTVSVNGNKLGSGYFNLGGGGITQWTGAGSYVNSNADNTKTFMGGTSTFTGLKFALNAGINTITFSYTPDGASNNGGQGFADESWKIAGASVTAVPEPETYAMLLAGLGVMGAIARRRKQAA